VREKSETLQCQPHSVAESVGEALARTVAQILTVLIQQGVLREEDSRVDEEEVRSCVRQALNDAAERLDSLPADRRYLLLARIALQLAQSSVDAAIRRYMS